MTRYRYAATGFPIDYTFRLDAVRRMIWKHLSFREKIRFLSMSREQFRYLIREKRRQLTKSQRSN